MKKTIDFGSIDFEGRGRKVNNVTIDIEYKGKDNKKLFSACGNVWNARHTDLVAGGQCLDELEPYFKNSRLFLEVLRLWRLYHLNGMHPECIHQNKLGWTEKASQKVKIYEFKLNGEASRKQREIKEKAFNQLKDAGNATITEEEKKILNLEYFLKTYKESLSDDIKNFYDLNRYETKTLGWLTPEEHPEGVLSKPCPVCGYKYGHGWNYFAIPEKDEEIIYSILEGKF